MIVLTTTKLVENAKRAIIEKRLGIQRGHFDTRFVYEDGSVCVVGASLPQETLISILLNNHARYNWLCLQRAGYFEADSLNTVEALASMQLGYDYCCISDERIRYERAIAFFDFIASFHLHC